MTVTHLLLAIGMSLYILIGTHLEEMGLMARFENYAQYMRKVPMLIPSLRRRLATTGDE
jgi:protein-S-isoprenylcysteine O-methyltransferase Ste14